jgi:hypothetical protein
MKTVDTFVVKQDSVCKLNFEGGKPVLQMHQMQPDSFGVSG